ncbi:MAG: HupE/UreJ family protein [Myxococcota bacterium]
MSARRAIAVALLCALALAAPLARAHDARPAYLQITETSRGLYTVLWRIPVLSGMRLPVGLRMPDELREVREPALQQLSDSLVERRFVEAPAGGLAGARVEFPGLEATITDVLVRVESLDGSRSTELVRPQRPFLELSTRSGTLALLGAYLRHGIEHILFGFDHLLFVLALILIVPRRRVLVATVTAFTLAHSITLALAVLGVVRAPGPPVEAAIALSVLLLAAELVRVQGGQASLTARWPWLVAFAFGLLHGFGFAGALTSVGLPPGDVPLALFAFNVGVELGQLAFIAAVLALLALAGRFARAPTVERVALRGTSYAIGILAAFWFFERLASFRS